jgi:hypothetical protein
MTVSAVSGDLLQRSWVVEPEQPTSRERRNRTARAALAAANVTVLASTAPADPAFEDEGWGNGAFTEVFLDALRSHADRDHDGLVSVGDFEWYVAQRLPELTGGRQRLGIEKRFDGSIFVADL